MMPVKIVHPNTSTKGFLPRTMRSRRHPTIPTRQKTPSKRNFSRFRGTSRQYERVLVPKTNERKDWNEFLRSKIGDRKQALFDEMVRAGAVRALVSELRALDTQ